MYKAWIVARREYLALVATKSFWIGLLIAPTMALVAVVASTRQPESNEFGPKQIVLVDHSGTVRQRLAEAVATKGLDLVAGRNDADAPEWQDQLRAGKLLAIVEVPKDISGDAPVRIVLENVASSVAQGLRVTVEEVIRLERMKQAGLEDRQVRRVSEPVEVQLERAVAVERAPVGTTRDLSILVPFLTLICIMLGVTTGATPLLQGVIEEKQQRISEVLLGAVSPLQLMTGKLVGTAAVGTTVLGLNLALGGAVMLAAGLGDQIPVTAVMAAFGTSVLAMLMYGSLCLALGSASSEPKEAQGLLAPLTLLFALPWISLRTIVDTPSHPFAVGLSLFPLTAPLTMPLRLGVTQTVPDWQVAVSLLLVLLTTLLTVWAASRVFRIGILSQGRLPKLRELARWVFSS